MEAFERKIGRKVPDVSLHPTSDENGLASRVDARDHYRRSCVLRFLNLRADNRSAEPHRNMVPGSGTGTGRCTPTKEKMMSASGSEERA